MNSEIPRPEPEMPYIPTSRWPVTFGVIAIVFGVIGLFASLAKIAQYIMYSTGMMTNLISPKGSGSAMDKEMSEVTENIFSAMEKMAPKMIVVESVLAILAVILLVGGILLLMRRRAASLIIQSWAALKIVGGGLGAYMTWQMTSQMQSGMFAKISAGSPPGSPSPMQYVDIMYKVLFILQLVWLAALPVVFLIWLNREIIKDDLKTGVWK